MWYPLPIMRKVPINMAKALGTGTKWWRGFPALYIAIVFFAIPVLLLGVSSLFVDGSKGGITFGTIICIVLFLGLMNFLWWWFRSDGMQKTKGCFEARQNKKEVMQAIPLEWRPLTRDIERLKVFTGLPDDDEDEGDLEKMGKDVPECNPIDPLEDQPEVVHDDSGATAEVDEV